MAILIDPPRWPAHGTWFSHLVSDASLAELFEFADSQGLPWRAFDHDHYDVPTRLHADLIAAGAQPTDEKTLLRRLAASGLRLRPKHRTPTVTAVLPRLRDAWSQVLPGQEALGEELLTRWQEPHRHYHDVRHLALALRQLQRVQPDPDPASQLALWFHDAVHTGTAGADEEASAELAERSLTGVGQPATVIAEVSRLIRLTRAHVTTAADSAGAAVLDADLAILGAPAGRYHVYVRDVRAEYPQFADPEFARGRLQVVENLIARPRLYHTEIGGQRWEESARQNLAIEQQRWQRILGIGAARLPS